VRSKFQLGFKRDINLLEQIAQSKPDVRAKLNSALGDSEKEVVQGISSNEKSKASLADNLKLSADSGSTTQEAAIISLTSLRRSGFDRIEKLEQEYAQKYKSDLASDLLKNADSNERKRITDLLTSGGVDAKQEFFDSYREMLKSESGFSPDGSRLTLEQANISYSQAIQKYEQVYQTLPLEKKAVLDKFFGESLNSYRDSKEKTAEIASDMAITAASLVSAPLSGFTCCGHRGSDENGANGWNSWSRL
jgi:hypothetical protein